MSNINLIIEERAAEIGKFLVGRLLPFRQKRMIGPFIYIDHMGPVKLNEREHFDILPHPHIGLSTLTFLFEGNIMHRDTLGTEIEITPGAVNWMTAGSGIVHSERTPDYLRNDDKQMHGLQIWVALPKELEEIEPSFAHISAKEIPSWETDVAEFKLIAGEIMGHKSPVPVYSELYLLEIKGKKACTISLGEHLFGESGLYILSGTVTIDGNIFGDKQMLVTTEPSLCAFEISEGACIYLLGGIPFPEERFIDWNFVSSEKEKIEKAKLLWQNQGFPKIPGDEVEFVPYPVRK